MKQRSTVELMVIVLSYQNVVEEFKRVVLGEDDCGRGEGGGAWVSFCMYMSNQLDKLDTGNQIKCESATPSDYIAIYGNLAKLMKKDADSE